MFATLLVGLILVGVATALGTRALTFGRVRSANRLRSIEMYGFRGAGIVVRPPGLDITRLAERVGTAMASRLTRVDLVQMRRDLLGAGFYNVTAEAYLGFRILATFGLTAFLFLLAIAAPSAVAIVGLGIAVVLGWRLPAISVQRRAERRRDDIDSELPELIDLLVVSVEAGVGLGSAQQLIAGRLHGPMGDELRLMLQEQSMGLSTDQALTNLLERCETPSVRSFVRSLQQGERLGVSIGTILRNLAVEMRTRRRQAAEERAQKAPVKILFPLVFLIFPAIFIVTLGPAYFSISDALGGG